MDRWVLEHDCGRTGVAGGRRPGCPAERSAGHGDAEDHDAGVLRLPNLPLLVQEGRAGHPRRVRLRFHNPVSDCLCPPLSVTDDAKEGPVLLPSAVFATFPKPLANGNNFDGSRYHGYTIYVMTGYFSGRLVDRFEWSRREYGFETSLDELESADRGDWQTQYPEFCVESWCVIPDPKPGSAGFHAQAQRISNVAR